MTLKIQMINNKNHQYTSNHKRSQTLPMVLKKKKEIGDYVLCKTIGRGASGRVKLGIHKQTKEKVAIKMISRRYLSSSSTALSVQRELAILQLLHHPHLVELLQVLQDSSYVYFVMEYLEGGELFHVLAERGKLKEHEARHLFIQMITALTWCHAHHISHRDLKPENILLDKEKKKLKVVDFGMASIQPLNSLLKTSCGSPHYASPEIVKGKKYDGKATDVWSCGVILYAMLTGHLPFDDEHMGKLLAKIKTGRYRKLPDYLSSDASDLIKRILVVDPAKRMTMTEILSHPWLTDKSFIGTEFKFLQGQMKSELDPIQDPELKYPINQFELEGRIWETLKILWRETSENGISNVLSSYGGNLQKLTCKLLQERSERLHFDGNHSSVSLPLKRSSLLMDDLVITPSIGSSSTSHTESYSLSSQFETMIDTVSCCKTLDLPPTPSSLSNFENFSDTTLNHPIISNENKISSLHKKIQHNEATDLISPKLWVHQGELSHTERKGYQGSKSDVALTFIMSKPIEASNISFTDSKTSEDTWWICRLEPKQEAKTNHWLYKVYTHFQRNRPSKGFVTVRHVSRNEYETAGKLHQVLEECFEGRLTGRLYPYGKIVWIGKIKTKNGWLEFDCHIKKIEYLDHIQIVFSLEGTCSLRLEASIQELVGCLNRYEAESDWVAKTNGWTYPNIV